MLSGMGLEDKQIESIIEAHTDTINGLKEERDQLREKASQVQGLLKQIEELKSDTSLSELQKKFDEAEKAHKTEAANLKRDVTNAQNKLAEAEKARDELSEQLEQEKAAHQSDVEAKQGELDKAIEAANAERDGIQSQFDEYKAGIEAKEALANKANAYRKQVLSAAGIAPNYLDDVMAVTKLDGIELDEDGNISGADELIEGAKSKWGTFILKQKTVAPKVETPPKDNDPKNIGGAHELAQKIARERHERIYGKPQE